MEVETGTVGYERVEIPLTAFNGFRKLAHAEYVSLFNDPEFRCTAAHVNIAPISWLFAHLAAHVCKGTLQ